MPKMRVNAICKIPGCEKPYIAKNMCAQHYYRNLRLGDPLAPRKRGYKIIRKSSTNKNDLTNPNSLEKNINQKSLNIKTEIKI